MRDVEAIRADLATEEGQGGLQRQSPIGRLTADVPDLLAALAEAEARAERSWEMVLQQEARAFRAESALAQLREQVAAVQEVLDAAEVYSADAPYSDAMWQLRGDILEALSSPSTVTPPETGAECQHCGGPMPGRKPGDVCRGCQSRPVLPVQTGPLQELSQRGWTAPPVAVEQPPEDERRCTEEWHERNEKCPDDVPPDYCGCECHA